MGQKSLEYMARKIGICDLRGKMNPNLQDGTIQVFKKNYLGFLQLQQPLGLKLALKLFLREVVQ